LNDDILVISIEFHDGYERLHRSRDEMFTLEEKEVKNHESETSFLFCCSMHVGV
jgi:hypothetical protein